MNVTNNIKRIKLGEFPTPFHQLVNLGQSFSKGQKLWIKRDDMSGVASGGNKVRKLEFILAEAVKQGCDTIITTGAAQSNHAMLTAACCRKLGLDVRLVLLAEGVMETKGNLLLNQIMKVPVEFVEAPSFGHVYKRIEELKAELINEGRKPFVVPVGGSTPLGTMGYVNGVFELAEQMKVEGISKAHIVSCTGSGGTLAGLILGSKLVDAELKVTGILIGEDPNCIDTIKGLIEDACKLGGIENPVKTEDIDIKEFYGDGYAIPSKQGNDAIKKLADEEGLFVDPVYTGKALGGMLKLQETGHFQDDENIIFIHTGGMATLFAIPIE